LPLPWYHPACVDSARGATFRLLFPSGYYSLLSNANFLSILLFSFRSALLQYHLVCVDSTRRATLGFSPLPATTPSSLQTVTSVSFHRGHCVSVWCAARVLSVLEALMQTAIPYFFLLQPLPRCHPALAHDTTRRDSERLSRRKARFARQGGRAKPGRLHALQQSKRVLCMNTATIPLFTLPLKSTPRAWRRQSETRPPTCSTTKLCTPLQSIIYIHPRNPSINPSQSIKSHTRAQENASRRQSET